MSRFPPQKNRNPLEPVKILVYLKLIFLTNYRGLHYFLNFRVRGEMPADWKRFFTFSNQPDYSDLRDVLKVTREEIIKYGHTKEDLILQCSYDGQKCHERYADIL